MITEISQNDAGSLQELLRSLRKKQEESLKEVLPDEMGAEAVAKVGAPAVSPHASPSNPMSRNFVSTERDTSRYVDAQLDSFQISTQMRTSQESTLVSVLDAFGGITGPSLYDLHGNRKNGGATDAEIRRWLERRDADKLMKEAQEELEKRKEAERAAAAEALATGELLEGQTAKTVPVANGAERAVPIPDSSGSNPAPAPDAAVAVMPEPAATPPAREVATQEVASPVAATKHSITITV